MNQLGKTALVLSAVGMGAWLLKRRLQHADYSFHGKATLITGGSRGLGLVLARALTREGARVAICAPDRNELERAAADLAAHGGRPVHMPCDVTRAGEVQEMVRRVEAALGPIDVLINNAGIITVGPVSTMTRADFEEALAVNFWGAYNTIEAVLSLPAQFAVVASALSPTMMSGLLDFSNRLLPRPDDGETEKHLGRDSEAALTSSFLTTLTERAAERNNEHPEEKIA